MPNANASIATRFKKGQRVYAPPPPRKTIPAFKLPIITKMAAAGKRERRIALEMKMSVPTWIKCKKDFPEVADALALGQEMLFEKLIGYLMAQAKKGNVIAGIFLSKALCGLRENDEPSELRPQITINLPGAAPTVEHFRKGTTIDAPPDERPARLLVEKIRRG